MILQTRLPEDMRAARPLPGIQPVNGAWLHVDEAYSGQMALRRTLLQTRRHGVLACPQIAREAADEVLDIILVQLPQLGYRVGETDVFCPDGVQVPIDRTDPLGTLGTLMQCDLCLLHKPNGASEHILGAAVLCFPASWTLREKLGKPMVRIHKPVEEYGPDLARRVQRLLDGVRVGNPIWRFNQLYYEHADLYAPLSETAPARDNRSTAEKPYYRAERQTLFRLPRTNWVAFAIHTLVLDRRALPDGYLPALSSEKPIVKKM